MYRPRPGSANNEYVVFVLRIVLPPRLPLLRLCGQAWRRAQHLRSHRYCQLLFLSGRPPGSFPGLVQYRLCPGPIPPYKASVRYRPGNSRPSVQEVCQPCPPLSVRLPFLCFPFPVILMVFLSTKEPTPVYTSILFFFIRKAMPFSFCFTTSSLRLIIWVKLTLGYGKSIPWKNSPK